jgi:hypothetical protein
MIEKNGGVTPWRGVALRSWSRGVGLLQDDLQLICHVFRPAHRGAGHRPAWQATESTFVETRLLAKNKLRLHSHHETSKSAEIFMFSGGL